MHSVWSLTWFHYRLVGIVGTLSGRRDLSTFAKGARNGYHTRLGFESTTVDQNARADALDRSATRPIHRSEDKNKKLIDTNI